MIDESIFFVILIADGDGLRSQPITVRTGYQSAVAVSKIQGEDGLALVRTGGIPDYDKSQIDVFFIGQCQR